MMFVAQGNIVGRTEHAILIHALVDTVQQTGTVVAKGSAVILTNVVPIIAQSAMIMPPVLLPNIAVNRKITRTLMYAGEVVLESHVLRKQTAVGLGKSATGRMNVKYMRQMNIALLP
jgi:hypothetical protein